MSKHIICVVVCATIDPLLPKSVVVAHVPANQNSHLVTHRYVVTIEPTRAVSC